LPRLSFGSLIFHKGEIVDEAMKELQALAGDLDVKELLTQAANSQADNSDGDEDDDSEGWVDEHQKMSELELSELEGDVQPVRTMLVKVGPVGSGQWC
jgi:hypothetical protein